MFTGIATNYGIIKNIKEKKGNEYIIESDIDLSEVKIGVLWMWSEILWWAFSMSLYVTIVKAQKVNCLCFLQCMLSWNHL